MARLPGKGFVSSPIVASDRLFAVFGGKALPMLRATPTEYEVLGKARVSGARCATPSFADGYLFLRKKDGLACLDLRADR